MAEFPRRLAPATLRLKELIATRLGAPKLMFCHRRSSIDPGGPPRRRGRNCPTMLREMIEQVDWCRYVAGHGADLGRRHRARHASTRPTATTIG